MSVRLKDRDDALPAGVADREQAAGPGTLHL
jgi:hypothetical protein